MSQRIGQERIPLWMVRGNGRAGWRLFVGTLHEVVAYINRLHRESGVQHSAREVGQEAGSDFSTRLPCLGAVAFGIASWLSNAEAWVLAVA